MLAALPNGEGVAALCRVARFDRTPLLSRLAAMAIVQMGDDEADGKSTNPAIDPAIFDRELGESNRAPVLWLRQFQIQLRDPAASVAGWQRLIDEETKRLDVEVNETSPSIVSRLAMEPGRRASPAGRDGSAGGDRGSHARGGRGGFRAAVGDVPAVACPARVVGRPRAIHRPARRSDPKVEANALSVGAGPHEAKQVRRGRGAGRAGGKACTGQAVRRSRSRPTIGGPGPIRLGGPRISGGIDGQPIEAVSAIGARMLLSNLLQDYERYDEAADALGPWSKRWRRTPTLRGRTPPPRASWQRFLPKGRGARGPAALSASLPLRAGARLQTPARRTARRRSSTTRPMPTC